MIFQVMNSPCSRTYKSAPPASHALSLLFAILCIGRLFEKSDQAVCRAHDFFVLSRVALTFDTPVTTTTVMSVQAMASASALSLSILATKVRIGVYGSVPGDA